MRANQITKNKKDLTPLIEQKIDKNNENHIKMLYDIWQRFNNNDKNINLIDNKWSKYIFYFIQNFIFLANIGFQNKDPISDFRGTGLLGLQHLWNFSLNDIRAENVFNVSTNNITWYYFAACGINITGKVVQFVEERVCEKYFYDLNEEINLYNFTQCLYNEFFVGFNNYWIEKNNFNILMVNKYLEEFFETRAQLVFHRILMFKNKF